MCTGRAQRPSCLAGRPRGRPTEITPLSGGGRRTRRLIVRFGPVNRAVDRRHNGQNMTVGWSTDRSTRRAIWAFPDCNRQNFVEVINTLFLSCFLQEFQEQNFLSFNKFLKGFLCQKIWSLFVFKGLKKSKKRRSLWDWFLIFNSLAILDVFPRIFLCVFDFQTLYFSHTWAYHIYLIY